MCAAELAFLAAYDEGPRPPGWRLTPRAVVTFICGSDGETLDPAQGRRHRRAGATAGEAGHRPQVRRRPRAGRALRGHPRRRARPAARRRAGHRQVDAVASCSRPRSAATQRADRAGHRGHHRGALRYGWNYALLLAKGPHPRGAGAVAGAGRDARGRRSPGSRRSPAACPRSRTRWCRSSPTAASRVPELPATRRRGVRRARLQRDRHGEPARPRRVRDVRGAQAPLQLRDRGADRRPGREISAGTPARPRRRWRGSGAPHAVDDAVLEALVTAFRDLRTGRSVEGWDVERPSTVMCTAEAVGVATSLGLSARVLPRRRDALRLLPGHLLGVVRKDDPADAAAARLLGRRRAQARAGGRGGEVVAAAVGAARCPRVADTEVATAADPARALETLAASRGSPYLIGVRHHSPALAAAVPALLDGFRPEVLLIELPAECQRLARPARPTRRRSADRPGRRGGRGRRGGVLPVRRLLAGAGRGALGAGARRAGAAL